MVHPFKRFEENRHGRAVAKARGYQSGGAVRFPTRDVSEDLQRLRSTQGVESGRIATLPRDNAVAGPGRFPGTGGIKPSVLRRMSMEDMPHAKGGCVAPAIKAEIKSAIGKHDDQLHAPGARTKLARGGKLTGGADSGIGRMELAKRAATRRGKSK